MNKVILMGRITAVPELKKTQAGTSVLKFTIAVDRYAKDERQTDFISCVAFASTADFITRYFDKGRMIAIEGNIKTGSYEDKNGEKRYTTDIFIDKAHFTGESKQGAPKQAEEEMSGFDMSDFETISDGENPF